MGRRIAVVFLSFTVTFVLSKVLLSLYRGKGTTPKAYLPNLHADKEGTPIVGGVAFILGSSIATLFEPDLLSPTIGYPLIALLAFGGIGLMDDFLKERHRRGDGFTSLGKLGLQLLLSTVFVIFMPLRTTLVFRTVTVELGRWYYPFAVLFITSFVNAVNITDGLDGLASLSAIPSLLLLLSFRGPFSGALPGALIAFIWYNYPPAKTFMGDSGSHALGAYIAVGALLANQEILVLFAGGLFFLELFSSLVQIISIRGFGRKIFLIAPLHHALEAAGFAEGKIVQTFVTLSWVFAILSFVIWG
ncbi:MAG: phospho-N-acetylmuramoyl-pentapeptide-transferase [Spirochaetales bacterium]|nr:phospho-N-acetylmuramoyl-pentapeptide-transferase [Spirochaetales bacterium]